MAIVKRIVEAHVGNVAIGNRKERREQKSSFRFHGNRLRLINFDSVTDAAFITMNTDGSENRDCLANFTFERIRFTTF